MLASEVAQQLLDLIAKHGDREVVVDCPGMMETRGIDEIDISTDDEICIWPVR